MRIGYPVGITYLLFRCHVLSGIVYVHTFLPFCIERDTTTILGHYYHHNPIHWIRLTDFHTLCPRYSWFLQLQQFFSNQPWFIYKKRSFPCRVSYEIFLYAFLQENKYIDERGLLPFIEPKPSFLVYYVLQKYSSNEGRKSFLGHVLPYKQNIYFMEFFAPSFHVPVLTYTGQWNCDWNV